jgi:hypothetical protein
MFMGCKMPIFRWLALFLSWWNMDLHYLFRLTVRHVAIFILMLCTAGALRAQQTATDSLTSIPDSSKKDGVFMVQQSKDSALPLPPPPGMHAHLYRMNYWVSGGLSLVATALNIQSINRIRSKSEITSAEIAGLNPSAFNEFEQMAFHQDPTKTEQYDQTSDYILQGIVAAPVLLGFDKNIRKDVWRLLMMYYETHAITFSIYNYSFFGPTFQNKYRPVVYYTDIPYDARADGNNKNSQYSGHTASAAAATFFMAKVYNDYHPEFSTGKKYLLYGLASIPPLVEGYLRVQALKHFPSDVLIGFVIGATCGIVVPELHRFKRQAIKVGVIGTPAGPGLSLCWTPGQKKQASFTGRYY